MSGGGQALALKQDDVTKMLAAHTHLGTNNLNNQMEQYVYKRRTDGIYLINIKRTWEKLVLAARAIAAVENPADICVISSRPFGQRAVLKFSSVTGATPIAGRFTPGTFTNQIQKAFREPRLLIVTDPRVDHQPITEASYVNIPVVAFCSTDSPLKFVDIAIPGNNKAPHSIGLLWWLLAREVLRLKGSIPRELPWDVMVDLYFYRDADEAEKEEVAAVAGKALTDGDQVAAGAGYNAENWGGAPVDGSGMMQDDTAVSGLVNQSGIVPGVPAGGMQGMAPAAAGMGGIGQSADWATQMGNDWTPEQNQSSGQGQTEQWGAADQSWNN